MVLWLDSQYRISSHLFLLLHLLELSGFFFFFSSRRRHTRCLSDWSSDVCSSDLGMIGARQRPAVDLRERRLVEHERDALGPRQAAHARLRQRPVEREFLPARRVVDRSEERRVGKWWRARGAAANGSKQHAKDQRS